MLELKNITKKYVTDDLKVNALKGIDVKFRESEFVCVLGPSGCGKTTLLNIIGGLDKYTSGDLVINNKSTKNFTDRDWDTYRNHSVGFVFQNYNLISHQSVLSNVELALTIAGVSQKTRRKMAIKSLESVGLKDQLKKRPNQMSGGQMQRVAIARALVGDPDILLADEPTGALDSKTSIQIMELLKEVSKDRLVIMVTHNPELASKYATRVIKLLDGELQSDSNPVSKEKEKEKETKHTKTFMSFKTAFSLSLNNLLTKKGRTLLTAFAGSIGIIGIALILSLSTGVQDYINSVEEDTLSSYPITIEKTTVDVGDMLGTVMGIKNSKNENKEDNKIYSKNLMTEFMGIMSTTVSNNNLTEFKNYLEKDNGIKNLSNDVQYSYNLQLNLYMKNDKGKYIQTSPNQIMNKLGYKDMMSMSANSAFMSSSMFSNYEVFAKLLDNKTLLKEQYDIIKGRFPDKYNEVVLVVDENNEISDYTLYSLGLLDQEELTKKYESFMKGEEVKEIDIRSYSYEELLDLKFKLLLNTDYYKKEKGVWVNKKEDSKYLNNLLDKSISINVVGIVKLNKQSVASSSLAMYGGVGYLTSLEEYVINKINKTDLAKEQKSNPKINVLTGSKFGDGTSFNYNSLSGEQKSYLMSLSEVEMAKKIEEYSQLAKETYASVLTKLGIINLNEPSSINIYPKDFESKEQIVDLIKNYNQNWKDEGKEENVLVYTDMVGTLMSSVTSIVNMISYVLMAFVSISLIVSSIMIGIITYISVLERTKEIGILRSIGASKKDIRRVFNAETMIVGLSAGIIGIVVTLLLNIPISLIIKHYAGVSGLTKLPFLGALVLIVISTFLTIFAGLIPSNIAAKKDPVIALRTE